MHSDRNADILRHIVSYCDDISSTVSRFGENYNIFLHDSVYKNATALCVLQIGELTTHLTDQFKSEYTGIPWVQIKALRNVVAHNYGKIDEESLWETITSDIPTLRDYCLEVISELSFNQDELVPEEQESIDLTQV